VFSNDLSRPLNFVQGAASTPFEYVDAFKYTLSASDLKKGGDFDAPYDGSSSLEKSS
jgi:hypothetical protein